LVPGPVRTKFLLCRLMSPRGIRDTNLIVFCTLDVGVFKGCAQRGDRVLGFEAD
jgi:hypothetical protein